MTSIEGRIGLPGKTVGGFRIDGKGLQQTGIAGVVQRVKLHFARPKALPDGPTIDKAVLIAKARPLPKGGGPILGGSPGSGSPNPGSLNPGSSRSGETSPSPTVEPRSSGIKPGETVDTAIVRNGTGSPQTRPPRLVDRLAETIDRLTTDVEFHLAAVEKSSLADGKPSVEGRLVLAERQQTLARTVETLLARLESEEKDRLTDPTVDGLRKRLIALAVDVAEPRFALLRHEALKTDGESYKTLSLLAGFGDDEAGRSKQRIDRGFPMIMPHARLVDALADLRLALKPDVRPHLTGGFLTAVFESPLLHRLGSSPDEALTTAATMVRALSKGDLSIGSMPLVDTTDKAVRTLLSALRSNHYGDDAARYFVLTVDTLAGGTLLQDETRDDLGRLSAGEIRKLLPQDNPELLERFDEAVASGRTTARLRDDYEAQRSRTARALGPETMQIVEQSIQLMSRGAIKGVDDAGRPVYAGREELAGLLADLARTNKAASLQVGRLALVMERLAEAEETAFGFNRMGMAPGKRFDARSILDLTGISTKDIEQLRYDVDAVGDRFHETIERLAKVGFQDVGAVKHGLDRLVGGRAVLRNADVQDSLKGTLQKDTAALGKLLQEEIVASVLEVADGLPEPDQRQDPETRFRSATAGILGSIEHVLFKPQTPGSEGEISPLGRMLDQIQSGIRTNDRDLVAVCREISGVEDEISRRRQVLATHGGESGRLDLGKPAGLSSAKLILKAIELDDACRRLSPGAWRTAVERERDAVLSELKGFDATAMKRTFAGKLPTRSAGPPSIDLIRGLRSQAEAIIHLRETAPDRLGELRAIQTKLETGRQAYLELRRETAPTLFNVVGRLIHAAVLSTIDLSQTPRTVSDADGPSHDVASKRGEIITRLKDWGMDTDRFTAEIDDAIATPVTGRTLARWRDTDTNGSIGQMLGVAEGDRPKASGTTARDVLVNTVMMLGNKRRIDDQMRRELGALVGGMPNGSKFDLMSGTEIKLNTGQIAVEPTGTVTVRGRLSGSVFKGFTIEVGSKGEIKLIGLLGANVKAGLDLQAGWKPLESVIGGPSGKIDIKLAATLSGDIGYEGAGGIQLTFPQGEAGRRLAIETLIKLTRDQDPSAEIFETAEEVLTIDKHKGDAGLRSDVTARLSLGWQPTREGDVVGTVPPGKDGKTGAKNTLGFGASAGLTAGATLTGKKEIQRGLDKTVVKTETQTTVGVTARASLYGQTFSLLGLGTNQAIHHSGLQGTMDQGLPKTGSWTGGSATTFQEVASVGGGVTLTQIHKKKLEFDRVGDDGHEVLTKVELKEITDGAGTRTGLEVAALFNTRTLDDLDATVRDKLYTMGEEGNFTPRDGRIGQLRSMFEHMAKRGLSNSAIEVTYTLAPDRLALANRLFAAARREMQAGNTNEALQLKAAARQIIDDRENYVADKVSLLDRSTQKSTANRGNAMLVSLDLVSSTGSERVMMSVDLK